MRGGEITRVVVAKISEEEYEFLRSKPDISGTIRGYIRKAMHRERKAESLTGTQVLPFRNIQKE